MSIKRNKMPSSGKSPYLSRKDYQGMMNTPTEQDAIMQGKEFKRSEFKRPYDTRDGYQEMEATYSPHPLRLPSVPETVPIPSSELEAETCDCQCDGCVMLGGDSVGSELTPSECGFFSISSWIGIFDEYDCCGRDTIREIFSFYGKANMKATFYFPEAEGQKDGWEYLGSHSFVPQSVKGKKCSKDSKPCYQHSVAITIDCEKGFTEDDTGKAVKEMYITACGSKKSFRAVRERCRDGGAGGCCSEQLVIANEDGTTPAVDTVLKGGCLRFRILGSCCEDIIWTLTPTSGSDVGSSTLNNGVLCVGYDACGSLTITAQCPLCQTQVVHSVRIANGGRWVTVYYCDEHIATGSSYCQVVWYDISGDTLRCMMYYRMGFKPDPPNTCIAWTHPSCYCRDVSEPPSPCGWVNDPTYSCPNDSYVHPWVRFSRMDKWRC